MFFGRCGWPRWRRRRPPSRRPTPTNRPDRRPSGTSTAVAGAAGTERVTFLAFDAAQPIGIVGGFRSPRPDLAELVSMWTSPRFRRQGIGAALVHEVLAWAKAGGACTVELWVTEQRTEAVCFYRALGFVPTGDTAPLRPGSDEPVLRLSMPLDELA